MFGIALAIIINKTHEGVDKMREFAVMVIMGSMVILALWGLATSFFWGIL